MSEWVRLCSAGEAPAADQVAEFEAAGRAICLAHVEGKLHALDNWCPHRRGPLGQGWVEGRTVICPWHCWSFDVSSGQAEPPEQAHVAVYPLKTEYGDLFVNLEVTAAG